MESDDSWIDEAREAPLSPLQAKLVSWSAPDDAPEPPDNFYDSQDDELNEEFVREEYGEKERLICASCLLTLSWDWTFCNKFISEPSSEMKVQGRSLKCRNCDAIVGYIEGEDWILTEVVIG